jgi:hypothetical protein
MRDKLGSWETERFRTKCSEMGQNDELSRSSTCTYENMFLSVLQRDSNRIYLQIYSGQTIYDIPHIHVKCQNVTSLLLIRKFIVAFYNLSFILPESFPLSSLFSPCRRQYVRFLHNWNFCVPNDYFWQQQTQPVYKYRLQCWYNHFEYIYGCRQQLTYI